MFQPKKNLYIKKSCLQQEFHNSYYLFWILTGMLHILIAAYLFFDNIYLGVLLSPYIYFYVKSSKKIKIKDNRQKLCKEFKDAMLSVSVALNAGYSIENSFKEALKELKILYGKEAIIVREFKEIVAKISNNENIEEVLCAFADNSAVEDIEYFANIFKYAKRSGGNMIEIIRSTASTIRQKAEVEQEIQTIISGKKMEVKVMQIMPFAMIGYLRLTSPEFLASLYGNVAGIIVMSICLFIYVIAVWFAKRIVEIDI